MFVQLDCLIVEIDAMEAFIRQRGSSLENYLLFYPKVKPDVVEYMWTCDLRQLKKYKDLHQRLTT